MGPPTPFPPLHPSALEVMTAMAVRTTATAAAVFTAAVAVYALARRERRMRELRRVLAREQASHRLMSGCLVRDLEVFRRRIDPLLAQQSVLASAGLVLDDALSAHDHTTPPMEGGPR